MSYCDKMMSNLSSSPSQKLATMESDMSRVMSISLNEEPPQVPSQQDGAVYGPVAILWDIENCPVPSDVRPEDVAGNIRMALRVHPIVKGAVTMFSAYGDFNAFPRRLREGCQRTGVKLIDVPNGRKDAADKAILVDMFLFALDNRPPSSIMLISGDVDFAPALHILGQRGYTVVLVIPAGVGVSSALSNAGRFVWDWPTVVRGEGFVPPKALVPYLMSGGMGDAPDCQNEEEAIVYRGTSQSEYSSRSNINQMLCYNSSCTSRELSRASQSLLSSFIEGPTVDQNSTQEEESWVRPGDLQGLKGQLARLLEMHGGNLPLVRVPPEYLKNFRRPLYMAEYGVYKLVELIKKMTDTFVVVGKGHKKLLCLRSSSNRHAKRCPSTPSMVRKEKKGNSIPEENGSSLDEDSDDERIIGTVLDVEYEFDEHLESFRQEAQELLVCYSCPLPIGAFEDLYEQRYKKALNYRSFGVDSLEELIEKVRDVVKLCEDKGNKRKFLVASYVSG